MKRWTPNRKAEALQQIRDGQLDRAAFMTEHRISEDEMFEWERDDRGGGYSHKRRATSRLDPKRPRFGSVP